MNSRWVVLNALRNIEDIHSRKHKLGRIQRWNDQGTEWSRDWMMKGLNDEGTEWWRDWMMKGLNDEGTEWSRDWMIKGLNDQGTEWGRVEGNMQFLMPEKPQQEIEIKQY